MVRPSEIVDTPVITGSYPGQLSGNDFFNSRKAFAKGNDPVLVSAHGKDLLLPDLVVGVNSFYFHCHGRGAICYIFFGAWKHGHQPFP